MLLDTYEKITTKLGPAVANRKHWIILCDSEEGKESLYLLLLAMGTTLPSDTEVDYGECEFVNQPTRCSAHFLFAVVPKSQLSAEELNLLLALIGGIHRADDEKDVVCFMGPNSNVKVYSCFLHGLRTGKIHSSDIDPLTN